MLCMTVEMLMFTDDVPDEVRFAEQIIDNIVADHGECLVFHAI